MSYLNADIVCYSTVERPRNIFMPITTKLNTLKVKGKNYVNTQNNLTSSFECTNTKISIIDASDRIISQIESFSNLTNNWDGYHSDKPTPKAILVSIFIANYLSEKGISIDLPYPLSDGGIQLDLSTEKFQYEIEVRDNQIKLLRFDSRDELVISNIFEPEQYDILDKHIA